MKILIVFTTKTPGGAETYNDTWGCIGEANHREKSVEVNRQIIGKIYVYDGSEYSPGDNWDYESMADGISLIIRMHNDAEFLVLFHSDKTQVNELYEKIKEKSPEVGRLKFLMTEYSTTDRGNRIWRDHVSGFCGEREEINDRFIALWNDLWGADTFKTAQTLRYEILSPLVAHDLIEQAIASKRVKSEDVSPDLRKQIAEAVVKLNDPISQFCSMASINCGGFCEKLEELRKQCSASGADQSWETFHDELKRVAEQMEAQIEAIGG